MTETITPDEIRVGNGWRYQCWHCGHQVKLDKPFPKTCPGCGNTGNNGWWGCLIGTEGNGKSRQKNGDGIDIKNSKVVMAEGITTRKRIMLPINPTLEPASTPKQRDFNALPGGDSGNHRGRGQPAKITPKLLKPFIDRGLGCKLITRELTEQGLRVHYTTVARQLKRYRQQILIQAKV